eukprot:751704-Hanusia_phi.AAC.4
MHLPQPQPQTPYSSPYLTLSPHFLAHFLQLDDVRKATLDQTTVAYDAHGDEHYNCISAFHKSIRGSDPQAAVRQQRGEEGHELKGSQIYWLARMLEGGESPEVCAVCLEQEGNESLQYVARRMIRIASEDVGLADTSALVQVGRQSETATATLEAVKAIGMPECNLALCQVAHDPLSFSLLTGICSVLSSSPAALNATPSTPLTSRRLPACTRSRTILSLSTCATPRARCSSLSSSSLPSFSTFLRVAHAFFSLFQASFPSSSNSPIPPLSNLPPALSSLRRPSRSSLQMLSDLGWAKGYKYNHDYPAGCEQDYLPPELVGRRFLTVEPARKREASPAL